MHKHVVIYALGSHAASAAEDVMSVDDTTYIDNLLHGPLKLYKTYLEATQKAPAVPSEHKTFTQCWVNVGLGIIYMQHHSALQSQNAVSVYL